MQYTTIPFEVKLPDQAVVFSLASLYAVLDKVLDKRHARGRLYPLRPLLAIAILAKLVGQNQVTELAHWHPPVGTQLRTVELCQLFGLKRVQRPHAVTWSRILGDKIDPLQLEAVLDEFCRKQLGQTSPPRSSLVVAIDGKALRGSIEAGCKRGIYMMVAFLPE